MDIRQEETPYTGGEKNGVERVYMKSGMLVQETPYAKGNNTWLFLSAFTGFYGRLYRWLCGSLPTNLKMNFDTDITCKAAYIDVIVENTI